MTNIQLGDKVKCKITGFVGTATARVEFINGCVQYNVMGKVGKDNKLAEEATQSIDQGSLEVIKPKEKKIEKKKTGGPNTRALPMRGY